ncbi:LamG-like jellyroll fold domain-containing protein [Halorhabdus rudnickae]|uniref:LamG-like jellyroll fold domain-containing protein n=1 Tax=Halorhabdus rudnickae TaxID=1775544 RepID=UPI001083A274|nr:LamG-like jellyroll fold domain-containing protein [Halorhabdus rudnickae]
MSGPREEVTELLDEKPAVASALEEILDVDEDGPWEFDDLSIDSGTFGEIVSRDIVEKNVAGYRVVDRTAVEKALGTDTDLETSDNGISLSSVAVSVPKPSQPIVLAGVASLVFVVFLRVALPFPAVFRGSDVVLVGNDPWGYRYWLESLLHGDISAFSFSSLGEIPAGGYAQDKLLIVVLWWVAAALGGSPEVAGVVLAWYPVIAGVASAAVLYLIAKRLSEDRRIALATVLLLAVTPVHGYRTMLGFADHHAFDYVWVAVTVFALVLLATPTTYRSSDRWFSLIRDAWQGSVLLAVGIGAQIAAWRGGPILLAPIAFYVVYRAVSDVRAGTSPIGTNVGLLLGIAGGAILSVLAHVLWGWFPLYRVAAPWLLLGGAVTVLTAAQGVRHSGISLRVGIGAIVGSGFVVSFLAWLFVPEVGRAMSKFLRYMGWAGSSNIVETASIVGGEMGSIFGPILFFGLLVVLALPYLAWASWHCYRTHAPKWAVAVVYAWVFFGLAIAQVRFAGQLSLFVALFGAVGFVHIGAHLELFRSPSLFGDSSSEAPIDVDFDPRSISPRMVALIAVFFLVVASIGLVQLPVKQSQLTIDGDTYETATWVESFDSQENITDANYVLSGWGRNRVYNYFLSGNSGSYSYAKSHFANVSLSETPVATYWKYADRVEYVVADGIADEGGGGTLVDHLKSDVGSETTFGWGHFRPVYTAPDGRPHVGQAVPGALVTGRAAGDAVTIEGEPSIGREQIEYRRTVTTATDGWYAAIVPYAGEYAVDSASFSVTETAVRDGSVIRVDGVGSQPNASWAFETGSGRVAYDTVGGHHGEIATVDRFSNGNSTGLAFDGEGYARIRDSRTFTNTDEFSVRVRFRTHEQVDYRNDTVAPRLVSTSNSSYFGNVDGYQLGLHKGRIFAAMGNGSSTTVLGGPGVADGQWHVATLSWDGDMVRLFVDGRLVRTNVYSGDIRSRHPLVLGANADTHSSFQGLIDEVKFSATGLDQNSIPRSFTNITSP